MKKCEFCGKEISYHEQYCSDECEDKAKHYFRTIRSKEKLFGAVNVLGLLGLIVAGFWAVLQPCGIPCYIAACSLAVMGVLYILLPFGTDDQLKKKQIEGTVKFCRLIGILTLACAFVFLALGIFVFK